jgi:hypothetical protein
MWCAPSCVSRGLPSHPSAAWGASICTRCLSGLGAPRVDQRRPLPGCCRSPASSLAASRAVRPDAFRCVSLSHSRHQARPQPTPPMNLNPAPLRRRLGPPSRPGTHIAWAGAAPGRRLAAYQPPQSQLDARAPVPAMLCSCALTCFWAGDRAPGRRLAAYQPTPTAPARRTGAGARYAVQLCAHMLLGGRPRACERRPHGENLIMVLAACGKQPPCLLRRAGLSPCTFHCTARASLVSAISSGGRPRSASVFRRCCLPASRDHVRSCRPR